MKKLLIIAVLLFTTNFAFAEWYLSKAGVDSNVYRDAQTVKRDGLNTIIYWSLEDFNNTQKFKNTSFKSIKSQMEVDCKEAKQRLITMTFYSQNMGQGDQVLKVDSFPSEPIPKDGLKVKEHLCIYGGWKILREGTDYDEYIDTDTAKKTGPNTGTFWYLADLKKSQATNSGAAILSAKYQIEYDCNAATERRILNIGYSQNMGQGDEVFRNDRATDWKNMEPDTKKPSGLSLLCKLIMSSK